MTPARSAARLIIRWNSILAAPEDTPSSLSGRPSASSCGWGAECDESPEISLRKHVNCFPPRKRKRLTKWEEHEMRNLSIGPLVTVVLALGAGAATTASAAPTGNLATLPEHAKMKRSARIILSWYRAEAGTAAAQFIVDARFIAASPYTVERRSAGESFTAAASPTAPHPTAAITPICHATPVAERSTEAEPCTGAEPCIAVPLFTEEAEPTSAIAAAAVGGDNTARTRCGPVRSRAWPMTARRIASPDFNRAMPGGRAQDPDLIAAIRERGGTP